VQRDPPRGLVEKMARASNGGPSSVSKARSSASRAAYAETAPAQGSTSCPSPTSAKSISPAAPW
jgi:hypothetical protein